MVPLLIIYIVVVIVGSVDNGYKSWFIRLKIVKVPVDKPVLRVRINTRLNSCHGGITRNGFKKSTELCGKWGSLPTALYPYLNTVFTQLIPKRFPTTNSFLPTTNLRI